MEYVMLFFLISLKTFTVIGVYPDEATCKAGFEGLIAGMTGANKDIEIGCYPMDEVKKRIEEQGKEKS